MRQAAFVAVATLGVLLSGQPSQAAGLDPALQAKVDARAATIKGWASDPVVVAATKAHNASEPAEHAAMSQNKWTRLTVLDPFVRSFAKNEAGMFLKSKKTDDITEVFVSDAKGDKVAFVSKTSSWCHKGKPKHEVPMSGKSWQGVVEADDSTGAQQIQVSVPVMDGGKAIGSLVVGFSVAKL
jgi:hypothetical protein